VGTLPVAGSDEQRSTNEIGMAILVQELKAHCALATYVVEEQAHYHFTVKSNQPTLESDIVLLFETRGASDFVEVTPPDHGRIETRSIWCSTAPDYAEHVD
jgi:hypothetical protein